MALTVEWQTGGRPDAGLQRLRMAFERAGDAVANLGTHVYPRLVPVFETELGKQFDAEGAGPFAGKWAPLSSAYAKWKQANYPGRPILELTGKLRAALTSSTAPAALRAITTDSLEFGTRGVPYATAHQMGSGRMPARPPFDFGPEAEAAIQEAAKEGVRAAVKAASEGLLDFEGDTFEGQAVQTGAKGGRFIKQGRARVYLKRKASGEVVKRQWSGRKR